MMTHKDQEENRMLYDRQITEIGGWRRGTLIFNKIGGREYPFEVIFKVKLKE